MEKHFRIKVSLLTGEILGELR